MRTKKALTIINHLVPGPGLQQHARDHDKFFIAKPMVVLRSDYWDLWRDS